MHKPIAYLRIATALLAAVMFARAADAAVLSLDFNATSSADAVDTQPGFTPFTLSDNGSTVGGIQVTFAAVGPNTTLGDRDRATPGNAASFTASELYDDFIYAHTTDGYTTTTGLDLTLAGLAPNTPYGISLYSYDSDSPGPRIAPWTANGDYAFTMTFSGGGGTVPSSDDEHRYDATVVTDATGTIALSGRYGGTVANAPAVFADALVVSVAPEPGSLFIAAFAGLLILPRRRRA